MPTKSSRSAGALTLKSESPHDVEFRRALHELANILSPLLLLPDVLLQNIDADHPMREDLLEIKRASKRATEVVSSLRKRFSLHQEL